MQRILVLCLGLVKLDSVELKGMVLEGVHVVLKGVLLEAQT